MAHEQLHSSREWYRVWPAAASSRLHAAFSAVPQWASCLTPLDTFAAKWLAEVGWLPEHRVDSSNGVVFVKGQPYKELQDLLPKLLDCLIERFWNGMRKDWVSF